MGRQRGPMPKGYRVTALVALVLVLLTPGLGWLAYRALEPGPSPGPGIEEDRTLLPVVLYTMASMVLLVAVAIVALVLGVIVSYRGPPRGRGRAPDPAALRASRDALRDRR